MNIKTTIKYNNGQPCEHPGCLNHFTHPCEGCGRVAGKIIKIDDFTEIELDYWVAKAEDLEVYIHSDEFFQKKLVTKLGSTKQLKIDWNFIGPILQRDNLLFDTKCMTYLNIYYDDDYLRTIKRFLVKRKYGEEVKE